MAYIQKISFSEPPRLDHRAFYTPAPKIWVWGQATTPAPRAQGIQGVGAKGL